MTILLCCVMLAQEPTWIKYPPVKNPGNIKYKTLADIESHIDPKHGGTYRDSDLTTWAHETTHGINSDIRMRYRGRINGFYCLEDRAIILKEPNFRLGLVRNYIPQSMSRSTLYQLYMVSQARSWDDTPTYIFDEWIAYTNGSVCYSELPKSNRFGSVKGMFEFNIYAIALCQALKTHDPSYDDKELKLFVMWNLKRTYQYRNGEEKEVITSFKNSQDFENLRRFARSYFGEKFYNEVLLLD